MNYNKWSRMLNFKTQCTDEAEIEENIYEQKAILHLYQQEVFTSVKYGISAFLDKLKT